MLSKLTSRQNFLRYREHRIFKALVIAAAIAGVATLADAAGPVVGVSLFVPPLAACLFLVIAVPESAMAQPRVLLGDQVLCAAISIARDHALPALAGTRGCGRVFSLSCSNDHDTDGARTRSGNHLFRDCQPRILGDDFCPDRSR